MLPMASTALLAGAGWLATRHPSNTRNWKADESRLPQATFHGDTVVVRNVRNFDYRSSDDALARWEDRTFDLARLSSVWYVVVPFTGERAVAHTFVSFGFADSAYVGISVEARKEVGEEYNALSGLFRQYELMYVVADERDILRVRTNFRPDSVFLYRVNTTPARARALFVSMLRRANALRDRPEFYNTLTQNCTTTIVRHVNHLVPGRVPFSYRFILPGFADALAYDIGLLDTSLAFPELRRRAYVSDRARAIGAAEDFSRRIRSGEGGRGTGPGDAGR
jgi:Domain of unknown function (DUF4105)